MENDDTDNIEDKTQSNEGADEPEGFAPNAANDYNKDEATPIEGYKVPDENIQYLRMTTIPGEWLQYGNRWWFRHSDGTYTRNGWEWIWGNWYYFDAEGWVVTGWVKSGGKWYYCNENGKMATNWNIIDGVWYYFNTDGSMVTNWNKINGKWYYFRSSGAMVTKWQQISGKWYYFNSDGAMQSGWLLQGSNWYYLGTADDGAMRTNWNIIDGKWYYFNTSGIMLTGWQCINNNWYYMKSDGAMVTGWQRISYKGDKYWNYFNSDGEFITDSDTRGCSHGYSNFMDHRYTVSAKSIAYYSYCNTAYTYLIGIGAASWNSDAETQIVKASSSKTANMFFYDYSFEDARIIAQTTYL